MKDTTFIIEANRDKGIFFDGSIKNNKLEISSYLLEDKTKGLPESENIYTLDEENTEKLFKIISLNDFIELCKEQHSRGMRQYFEDNDIKYECYNWTTYS